MKKNLNHTQAAIDRREFLRKLGLGAGAVAGISVAGCTRKEDASAISAEGTSNAPIPTDKMTHRVNPSTGDSVSLLGYGCMRWPTRPVANGTDGEEEIDQDAVNALVDKAIAHGVNYFDTSPAYCKGHSEEATGIALSRHPRDKYFIATKLSNFAPDTWSREASMEMYRNSFKYLRTDHIDYLLLHAVGMGGSDGDGTRGRTHTQPRILLPRRCTRVRLSAIPAR